MYATEALILWSKKYKPVSSNHVEVALEVDTNEGKRAIGKKSCLRKILLVCSKCQLKNIISSQLCNFFFFFFLLDILHHAITKVINNRCQRHLDDVVHKVELDSLVMENDHQIRAMLEQVKELLNRHSLIDL